MLEHALGVPVDAPRQAIVLPVYSSMVHPRKRVALGQGALLDLLDTSSM
ncbi:MAG TPA: hypothetical protein VMO47_04100 [Rhodothermales bacterium]|nr:hypothetical protein [Rhodothermales bacterium]